MTMQLVAPLDIPSAAQTMGISEWLTRKLIERGELRSIRIGRLVRIPHDAIAEFLERGSDAE